MSVSLAVFTACITLCASLRLQTAKAGKKWESGIDGALPWQQMKKEYQQMKCDFTVLQRIREESMKNNGLIISGQPGSRTRVAQEIVDLAGTHSFGLVDRASKDSWAARWAGSYMNVSEEGQTVRSTVLYRGHGLDYKSSQMPKDTYAEVADQVCRTLMIIDDMIHKDAKKSNSIKMPAQKDKKNHGHENQDSDEDANKVQKPWALKDPYLRIFMPFFSDVVNYKFVHVTRDPRCIHETHAHEEFYNDLHLMTKMVDEQLEEHSKQAVSFARTKQQSMFNIPELQKAINSGMYSSAELPWVKFAHVWATMELTLQKKWLNENPRKYFRLSEHNMPVPGHLDKADMLAKFLGQPKAPKDVLEKMSKVYTPATCNTTHWDMMNNIIQKQEQGVVRHAMEIFGYKMASTTGKSDARADAAEEDHADAEKDESDENQFTFSGR